MSEFLRKLRGNKGTIPDFPGGTADKNPPANARDILSLVWEDSTCHGATKPMHHMLGPHAANTETHVPRDCSTTGKATAMRSPLTTAKGSPCLLQLEKTCEKQQRPSAAKNK